MIYAKTDLEFRARLSGFFRLFVALVFASQLVVPSAQAKFLAKNRNDVYQILDILKSNLDLADFEMWVNRKAQNPVVYVGDTVYFTMASTQPVFYTLIHVDSKGSTVVIQPTSLVGEESGSASSVYPELSAGCRNTAIGDHCFDEKNRLVQTRPIGQDAVYLLASHRKIPADILGLNESKGFRSLGREIGSIEKLVQQINVQSMDNPINVIKYTYAVESRATQYSTRSISKKVNRLAQGVDDPLVFNNVNFAFNSSELTDQGRVELDGLGSVLVGVQEQQGEIPLLELTGHTDSIGKDDVNMLLSKQRAESVKQYLVVDHGLSSAAIWIAWKGESEPLDSNETAAGRAMNRRVVLNIQAKL